MIFDYNDKNTTRFLEQNICNLAYAHFEGVGEYDIPKLLPTHIDDLENIALQGFNFALREKFPEHKGVHFFLHDYQFERVWNRPDRYTEMLSKFAYVLSPDFSPYANSPKAIQIYNIYRKNWCARYWQDCGIKVIPTITWGNDEDINWYLDGVPKHSTIAVSTMGEGRWGNWQSLKKHWNEILDILEPDVILLYGKDIRSELSGNIVFKPMTSRKVD